MQNGKDSRDVEILTPILEPSVALSSIELR